jgi:hypothetical protein
VRRGLVIVLLGACLAGCGGDDSAPEFAGARERTVADGTAAFNITIDAVVAGNPVRATETGAVSFTRRRAHLYKLVPGGGLPQELVLDGPFTYTNANVEAAMHDSSVPPWTKLDTRRLTSKQRAGRPDELAHVRAVAHLSDGVAEARQIGETGKEETDGEPTTKFRGRVDPELVVSKAPAGQRAALAQALRNDYPAKPFAAEFWLDADGRLRRVHVGYRTDGGTLIALDGRFTLFGEPVDVTLPAADKITDITP